MGRLSFERGVLRHLYAAFAGSVRHKLLALVLAPLLLGVPVLLLIVWVWGTEGYNQLMVNKVSADLGTAQEYFDRVQSRVSARLDGFAESHKLITALDRGDPDALKLLMRDSARDQGLDYLLLLDAKGRVQAGRLDGSREDRSSVPVVRSALAGKGLHGLEVFSPEQLESLNSDLRRRAYLDLVPTRNAREDGRASEERGLMMVASVPVLNDDGSIRAVLEGGILLNGNLDIVDRLNDLVYQEASLPSGSEGSATLFMDDTRIATSVRLHSGQRALGTRVSQAVYDKVMGQGLSWMGSAFVVENVYVSGYRPLSDVSGKRVGMLYVGFLESPLRKALSRALAGMFLMFLLVSALGTVASIRWAQAIFLPLERMSRVIQRVENEDDSARVGPNPSRDELGRLSRAFDHLLDSLASRREELRRWGQELDRKVEGRTAELEAANNTLRQAQQQLVMNEKLTAIGELTAGVAHEINNPVAVIQGNLDLLKEILGEAMMPVEQEIRLIDEQTLRIQSIVNKLLQFARPGDFAGYAEDTDVNAALSDCLVLTRHNLNRAKVKVVASLEAATSVEMNRGELQQVLINLLVNAMQAMTDGGVLTLESRDVKAGDASPFNPEPFEGISLLVRDTGHGINAADLGRIFDPFFTTKKQKGTGLGLSISYAIVQRYGGRITVESQPGVGTAFTLWLRHRASFTEQPSAPVFSSGMLNGNG
ncbi:MAG TPA: cache domain-containing protein [Candidatus Sulfotelmatobacter sp.]|jgi:two-component system NtrC family sensor kinase|nr:cache domain-containing protein [Candidatus Sulfotelmatobacter sp.]